MSSGCGDSACGTRQRVFFAFFLASGFCGLLYEVVWLRLAMARFGVTTTVVSVVLSVFMLGIALGSWIAGSAKLLAWLRTGRRYLRAYALVELAIGTGAVAVPALLDRGRDLLLGLGEADSATYHAVSALVIAVAILPWATLMGMTYSLAMGALRARTGEHTGFSYLYLANVLGAAIGTVVTALVLVELLGFRNTLMVAAAVNAAIFLTAWPEAARDDLADAVPPIPPPAPAVRSRGTELLVVLFTTGFLAMALEVVWTRLFSRYLGTFVYSFAAILATYLLATYAGSQFYRKRAGSPVIANVLWACLGVLSILPLACADRRLWLGHDGSALTPITLLGIVPFCAALGYLTPLLVDRYSRGDEALASRAYAVNVIGCVLGPLAAGYLLLPELGERGASAVLALLPVAIGLWAIRRTDEIRQVACVLVVNVVLTAGIAVGFRSYAETFDGAVIARDHVATAVAFTDDDGRKRLLVNGVGITSQTTITKVMAHMPLAMLPRQPRAALAICFGMGTTFRSLTTWKVRTVAVDLVPSVPAPFDYFVPGGRSLIDPGRVDIVIDDGRRFLQRTGERFDVITLDPPPPVQAAGSSLLYSRELYQVAKQRLADDGILQQWLPTTDPVVTSSVAQALVAEFPYVRVFGSIEGWGLHFFASMRPLPTLDGPALVARMPAAARADLVEWLPGRSAESIIGQTLANEIPVQTLIDRAPDIVPLSDDRPTNEYFLVREAL
jgi:spermidine synthase